MPAINPSTGDVVVSVQDKGLFPTEHVGVSLGRDREWKLLFDYWTMGYASPSSFRSRSASKLR
ncbi:MAG: hypothetical protein KBD01_08345 [Acidobacteria bacterium]|nr:hypothetical protein [Acidobacteriota bacterium]